VVEAAFITPVFRLNPPWQKGSGGRDECCPYHRIGIGIRIGIRPLAKADLTMETKSGILR